MHYSDFTQINVILTLFRRFAKLAHRSAPLTTPVMKVRSFQPESDLVIYLLQMMYVH